MPETPPAPTRARPLAAAGIGSLQILFEATLVRWPAEWPTRLATERWERRSPGARRIPFRRTLITPPSPAVRTISLKVAQIPRRTVTPRNGVSSAVGKITSLSRMPTIALLLTELLRKQWGFDG